MRLLEAPASNPSSRVAIRTGVDEQIIQAIYNTYMSRVAKSTNYARFEVSTSLLDAVRSGLIIRSEYEHSKLKFQ
jgi:hypothetical protein